MAVAPDDFDANAARIVRILLAQADMKVATLAAAVGMSTSVLYTRLSTSTEWRAWELAAIAAFFEQGIDIFAEASDEVVRTRSR